MAGTQTYKHHAWHWQGQGSYSWRNNLWLVFFFDVKKIWCSVCHVRFRMKRMEWGWEKKQAQIKLVSFWFLQCYWEKTTPPWPLMSVITIKKIYIYDHAAACLACRKSPQNFSFKAPIHGFFHTKSSTHPPSMKVITTWEKYGRQTNTPWSSLKTSTTRI